MRRWLVERFFAWIQWQRRILVRWEYHAQNFCRDKISLGNPANSGLVAANEEISVSGKVRGAERTRTACQARSRYRTGLSRVSPPRQFCDRMSLSDNIIQKGLAFGRHWSGTVR